MIAAWLVLAGALQLVISAGDTTLGETADILPPDSPVHVALDEISSHFGDHSDLSSAVIVFEKRDGALDSTDLADVEKFAKEVTVVSPAEPAAAILAGEMKGVSVRTPATFALAGKANPLVSADSHAALVWIGLPYNFITKSTARIAAHTQEVLARHALRPGVSASVTGSAGYGYDYAVATENSHQKTSIVTVIAVIVILLLVYRAPVAAVIPLLAVSVAAAVAFKIMAALEPLGLHGGSAERIFTFVLLYGAGIDYSLLFMGRYREFLDEGMPSPYAVRAGLLASRPAIVSSALMTIAGLSMLCFARFSVFRNSGPVVCLAIAIAALAATTLVPAALAVIGPVTFWPGFKPGAGPRKPSVIWSFVARRVSARPAVTMILMLVALGVPAINGARIRWNYDALYSLKPTYQARRGTEMVERHWPTGEIAPVTLLVTTERPRTEAEWTTAAEKLTTAIRAIPDVDDIRGVSKPLGLHADDLQNDAALLMAGNLVRTQFVSPDGRAMRLSVVLKTSPSTRQAMAAAAAIRTTAALVDPAITPRITGVTAEMTDLRDITLGDFHRLAAFTLLAILIVVWLVLRDLPVALFILAATVLSYLTTLGITSWIFQSLGSDTLEWKVQMLLFVVLIAVGQDYSIFFAVRLAQEARQLPCRDATRQALIATGPVISSCGLIMAATLGSIMAGDVQLLVQLGLAFALGMLIDTFIVRPLLLPSLILLTGRTLQKAKVGG